MTTIRTLPAELVRLIATCNAYELLTTCRSFHALAHPTDIYDHMIAIGYTVDVGKNYITWYKNGLMHNLVHPGVELVAGAVDEYTWFRYDRLYRIGGPAMISVTPQDIVEYLPYNTSRTMIRWCRYLPVLDCGLAFIAYYNYCAEYIYMKSVYIGEAPQTFDYEDSQYYTFKMWGIKPPEL